MKRSSPNRPSGSAGLTLIELMISMALAALLMTSVYAVLKAAVRYYLNSNKAVDVQQSALLATSAVSTELMETNMGAILEDITADRFVTFGSPRDVRGEVPATTDGQMLWQKYICYWAEAEGEISALFRKEEPFTPTPDVPVVPGTFTMDHFKGLPGPARRITEHIYSLDVRRTSVVEMYVGAEDRDKKFRVVIYTKLKPRN